MQTQQEKLRYDTTWWRGNYCTQNNNVQNTFLFKKKMVICECEKYAPDSPTFHIGSMLRARWWWGSWEQAAYWTSQFFVTFARLR